MEIRLAKLLCNNQDKSIRVDFLDNITENQFKEFETSINTIEELHSVRRLKEYVLINEKEFIDFLNYSIQNLLGKSTSWDGVKRKDGEIVYINANRLLLNYLCSTRTFVDHSETFIIRKFGKYSENYKEFKKILSIFFDKSFAYRFFYKLRDYSQHVGIPLNTIKYSAKNDRENKRIHGALILTFNRDKLLSNFDRWGKVKKDLEVKETEFEVVPLLFEMTHIIGEIERKIEQFHKEKLIIAAIFITNLIKHLQDTEGEVFVAYDINETKNGEDLSYNSINIPYDTIEFILNDLIK